MQVAVIGGGIIGITTAVSLAESGYRTTIFTHHRLDERHDTASLPHFASLFPAACIVPHTVEMPDLLETFSASQSIFSKLADIAGTGVRWQEHYELFGGAAEPLPPYARALHGCSSYGSSPKHLPFAEAIGAEIAGWVARVLFAEMPVYVPFLYQKFFDAGGSIVRRQIEPGGIKDIPADVVVNCSGLGSRDLTGDADVYPILGHLLFLRGCPFPPITDAKSFSYNYTPPPSEYPNDVYFFPRSGGGTDGERGWLLGGSREPGIPDGTGGWKFNGVSGRTVGGFPGQAYDLNRKILRRITGTDIDGYEVSSKRGYRPSRKGGVRLEATEEGEKLVIHNYGHGGGGVALSWGCAQKVKSMVPRSA